MSIETLPDTERQAALQTNITVETTVNGRAVLDLCCNSGGFAVYAKALGGAAEVTVPRDDERALHDSSFGAAGAPRQPAWMTKRSGLLG